MTVSGFLAQDVETAASEIGYDFSGVYKPKNGGLYGLQYSAFVMPLVKAVQELSTENNTLKARLDAQEHAMQQLSETVKQLSAKLMAQSR